VNLKECQKTDSQREGAVTEPSQDFAPKAGGGGQSGGATLWKRLKESMTEMVSGHL
jgi:hypothetical protein